MIICNAAYWNLVGDSELTADGYDMTLQVDHISHVALVLHLLGSFAREGWTVLLSSIAHYRKLNVITSLLPDIPEDMEELNHPPSDGADGDKKGRGFQRYACAKLVFTTWGYALERYLKQNPKYENITVVSINPGGLGDSRCFITNAPRALGIAQTLVLQPFMSVISFFDPTFRSSASAGVDIAELAVGNAYPGECGYFTMLERDDSDAVTRDERVQERVWKKSLEWAKISKESFTLKGGLPSLDINV